MHCSKHLRITADYCDAVRCKSGTLNLSNSLCFTSAVSDIYCYKALCYFLKTKSYINPQSHNYIIKFHKLAWLATETSVTD